jgi:hypothetical protein
MTSDTFSVRRVAGSRITAAERSTDLSSAAAVAPVSRGADLFAGLLIAALGVVDRKGTRSQTRRPPSPAVALDLGTVREGASVIGRVARVSF